VGIFSSLTAGVVLGLSAGLTPGPLLAFLITQSLKHGIKEGVKVALAPLITDLPIVAGSLFLLTRLTDFERILGLISLAGGLYVLYLSFECARTGTVNLEASKEPPRSIKRGSLINALNPHPYLFWITVGAPLVLKFLSESHLAPITFVSCFYALLVGSKIFLALFVGKSRSFLTGKAYVYTMRTLGAMLAFFALILLKDALVFLGVLHF
jgi:threonine/homoserine/homoserine lactone efflux protein